VKGGTNVVLHQAAFDAVPVRARSWMILRWLWDPAFFP